MLVGGREELIKMKLKDCLNAEKKKKMNAILNLNMYHVKQLQQRTFLVTFIEQFEVALSLS